MPVERYRYDPRTGSLFHIGETGEMPYEGNVPDLLNGKYTLQGTQLVNLDNPFIREQMGRSGITITRTMYPTGISVVTVSSEIAEGTLNTSSQRLASYSVVGDITVLSESGTEHTLSMEAASVTGFGQRLLTYVDANDIRHFESVTAGDEREAFLRELYGPTVEWATSEQYTASAIAGYIKNHGDRLIHEVRAAGGIRDASGVLQTTGSGIVRAIAQMARGGLTFRKDIVINATGDVRGLYEP